MKAILYATDYSENSVAALKYAHALSIKLGAELNITHIFDYPTLLDTEVQEPFPHLEEDAYRQHNKKLRDFIGKYMPKQTDDIQIETAALEHKSVVRGLIEKIDEIKPAFLIVGIKGGSAIREVLMGNTTKQLLGKAPCPVLCIPADYEVKDPETIIYATDFELEDLGVIHNLVELASPYEAEIQIVHISTGKEYAGRQRKEWFEEHLKKEFTYPKISLRVLLDDNVFHALKWYLTGANPDLVVMFERKKRGFIEQIFHRDLVKKMETYGQFPLLAFNVFNYQPLTSTI
ncbi:MAG: universal stress protein [Eudoraea sp.]|nr:universal stress protein [Eudoraea sp.]